MIFEIAILVFFSNSEVYLDVDTVFDVCYNTNCITKGVRLKELLYVEIAEKIMDQTLSSNLAPGSKIASVRVMALEYEVNPKTIQKAFDYLDDRGIFSTVVGGGRYLSSDSQVLDNIRQQLVAKEIDRFTKKMLNYDCDFEFVTAQVKRKYEEETDE